TSLEYAGTQKGIWATQPTGKVISGSMGEAPADGADGGPPTHPLDPVGIAWQEYIVRTGGLHVLSPLVHDKRSAAINDARSPRPNSKGKMLHRFVIKTLLPDHPPHDTSLPNDIGVQRRREALSAATAGWAAPPSENQAMAMSSMKSPTGVATRSRNRPSSTNPCRR